MEDQVIKPTKETLHPVTAIMLSYLNKEINMKKLFEWKDFFNTRREKNNLANVLSETARKIIEGETVEEVEFAGLMWMLLRFGRTKEEEAEKIRLEKEVNKLRKEIRTGKKDG